MAITDQSSGGVKRADVPFWVTIVRGLLATLLGLPLLVQPGKARPMLVNLMGMFWLASGIVSIRRGASGQATSQIWPILAGVSGVIASFLGVSAGHVRLSGRCSPWHSRLC